MENSNINILNNDKTDILSASSRENADTNIISVNNKKIKDKKFKFLNLEFEDIILFTVLFLLIDEEVEDNFLILIILFLILSGNKV